MKSNFRYDELWFSSNNHQQIVKVCEENKISYSESLTTVWQDCGEILPKQDRSELEKKRKFIDCCNSGSTKFT